MIITDKKNTAYANICLDSPFSVKAEARKDIDGGYCALFYVDGRSVAFGRKEALDEAKGMVSDFITAIRNEVSGEFEFDYDEPVETEEDEFGEECNEDVSSVEQTASNEASDEEDNGEHF